MAGAITLETVTLDAFIACVVHGDLRRLDGEASEADLAEAWERLYAEFNRRSGGSSGGSSGYLHALRRRVQMLEIRLQLGALALALQGEMRGDMLKRLGYREQGVEGAIRRDSIACREAIGELRQAESRQPEKGEKVGEEYFTKWIVLVGKFVGYRIDRNKVTVSEFLESNSLMLEESRALSSMRKKG